jgi:HlyD family secretion protein
MDAAPRLHPRRPLFWVLLALAVAIAAWGFWPRARSVETAAVVRGELRVGFSEEARTRVRDRWLVSAPLSGVVDRIALRPGDRVAAGQTVATLWPAPAAVLDAAQRADALARLRRGEQAERAAAAAVEAADVQRARSDAQLRRGQALAGRRLVSAADLDTLRMQARVDAAALRSAAAQREAARIEQRAARAVLALQGASRTGTALALPSPVEGRVLRRLVESASPVQAGQPLLELGDPRAIEVVAEILTADAVRIAPGTAVRLTRWGGDATLRGRVRVIEPGGFTKVSALGVEEQRTLAVIDLVDPPAARARLGDGYRLEADFEVWRTPDALQVPTAALFRDGPHWAVYAIEGGRARLRHVLPGPFGEDAAAVASGLREGERVVLYPGDDVRDGLRVRGP